MQAVLPIVFCLVAIQLIILTPVLEKGSLRVQAAVIAMILLLATVIAVPNIIMLAFAALGMSLAALATTLEYS